MGQFSTVSFTPLSWAWRTMSGQTVSAASQFWSGVLAASPPMKVLTSGTPMRLAAVMTCLRWPMTCSRWAGSGCSALG